MKEKLKYYLLSDTHFGHRMLTDKGYRPVGFEKKILWNLELDVPQNSIIIHCGDFCMTQDSLWHLEFFKSLPTFCKVILVRGNHDRKSDTWYYEQGWSAVCDSFKLNKYGKKILFSHEPIQNHSADINIHGHWHDNNHRWKPEYKDWYDEKRYKLVSMEKLNYKPVCLLDFIFKP